MPIELQSTDLTTSDYQYHPFYVRKSHIESYSFCPRQFYLQYIKELEPFENYAMSSGTRFHDFAEKFFDVAPQFKVHEWNDLIPEEFGGYERPMAEYFVDYEIDRYCILDPELWMPLHREIELFSDEFLMGGRLDRIDAINLDENTVEVVEYKTSKKVDELSLKRQLGFYTILVEEQLGYTVENVRLINPRLKLYQDFGRPDTALPMKWAEKIREAYYNHDLCGPKCSTGKYAVCQLCQTTEEAGLWPDLEAFEY